MAACLGTLHPPQPLLWGLMIAGFALDLASLGYYILKKSGFAAVSWVFYCLGFLNGGSAMKPIVTVPLVIGLQAVIHVWAQARLHHHDLGQAYGRSEED
ncbi:hypothetical protein KQI84_01660 [bacterium]|nr:hypothetical protein [bacterium]